MPVETHRFSIDTQGDTQVLDLTREVERRWSHSARPKVFWFVLGACLTLDPSSKDSVLFATDCNRNGLRDLEEIASQAAHDCNGNGLPDECDFDLYGLRFEPAGSIPFGDSPDVVAADFNGDAIPDLAADVSIIDSTVLEEILIFTGDGKGGFEGPRRVRTRFLPRFLTAGDLDSDGDIDIALLNGADELLILRNPGDGRFRSVTSAAMTIEGSPSSLLAVDLEGDGDLDLAVYGPLVKVLENDGSGGFTEHHSTERLRGLRKLVAADLDGDRDLDLAGASDSHDVRGFFVLRNQGDGTFAAPEVIPAGATQFLVVAADLDGDGDIDLAGSNASEGTSLLVLNQGGGAFGPPLLISHDSRHVLSVVRDMDGDGDLDLISQSGDRQAILILPNIGGVRFGPPREVPFTGPLGILVEDFNVDGRPDLAAVNVNSGELTALLQTNEHWSLDCNTNRIPDECDAASGGAPDCNRNLVPDGCELTSGASPDCNRNGAPDDCDLIAAAVRFRVPATHPAGASPSYALSSDLDFDGDLDLAVSLAGAGAVLPLLNQGDGTFAPAPTLGTAEAPGPILAGDFNGDGRADLVAAHQSPMSPYLLLFPGDGGGGFGHPSRIELAGMEGWQKSAVTADLDGDADLDLAAGIAFLEPPFLAVGILLNGGDGSFRPPRRVVEADGFEPSFAGDVDQDGDADLVLTGRGIALLSNDRDGSFVRTVIQEASNLAATTAVADLDGDGDMDLAFGDAAYPAVKVFLNLGDALFRSAGLIALGGLGRRTVVTAADLNGDRHVDLLAASELTTSVVWLRNTGGARFSIGGAFDVGRDPVSVVSGDFNRDGAADLAAANSGSGDVTLLINDEPGRKSQDCNGDGVPDECQTAEADCNGNRIPDECDLSTPISFFDPVEDQGGADPFRELHTGDLDGDGDTDLVMTSFSASFYIYRNLGQAAFDRPEVQAADPNLRASRMGDLNGDGNLDLLLALEDKVSARLGDGRGSFAAGPSSTHAVNLISPLADLDGDRDLDVVAQVFREDRIRILLNSGDGSFAAGETHPVPSTPWSAAAADLDGDGNVDLAVANRTSQNVSTFFGKGGGRFTAGSRSRVGEFPGQVIAGDLDGDGDADLAVANESSPFISVLFNRGDGALEPALNLEWSERFGGSSGIAAVDVDRDARLDLIASVKLLRSVGKGRFAPPLFLSLGTTPRYSAFVDLEGDGDVDIVSIPDGSSRSEFYVVLNRTAPPPDRDCDHDAIPDKCAPDCNGNGSPDRCDVVAARSADCNGNFLPDECDIAAGGSRDRNANAIPDECEPRPHFHRGDPNGDGAMDVSDGLCMLEYLFDTGPLLSCLESADANNDGRIDCSDPVFIFGYLFLGTEPPLEPGPPARPCGADSDAPGSIGDLGCESYLHCPSGTP